MAEHRTQETPTGPGGTPLFEPTFARIVETMALPALIWTGQIKNPLDDKGEIDLDSAKQQITMLEVLEKKTKGNLEKDEEEFLHYMLHNVRLAFVRAKELQEAEAKKKEEEKQEKT